MADEQSPIKIKKIGHVVYTVSDLERTSKFWTEVMGFKFSDRNEAGMVFFRNATDHHTVALMQAKENTPLPKRGQLGFDHFALEVATVSELFKIRDFLKSKGVSITYEGRRGPGGKSRRGVSRSGRIPNRDLRGHGPDRRRWQKPAGKRMAPRDYFGRSCSQPIARRPIQLMTPVSKDWLADSHLPVIHTLV